jgi:hypothetical protein
MKHESAFPTGTGVTPYNPGMTLRDYFAAKAMQAVYAKHWDMFMDETYDHPDEVVNGTASDAYEIADAMLKAREE